MGEKSPVALPFLEGMKTTPAPENSEPTSSLLKELANDFKARENHVFSIQIKSEEVELQAAPLNTEDQLKLLSINEETDAKKKASMIAHFLVNHVLDSDGGKAFRPCHNMMAADVLKTMVNPEVVMEIFGQVCLQGKEGKELEEAAGK